MGRLAVAAGRRALAAALWLTTLYAVYLTVRRSGAYGLITEAQNLIALYGVLRAAVYTIEAHQAIRRRGITALFRPGGRRHDHERPGHTHSLRAPSGP
jgi:hypothetical protein